MNSDDKKWLLWCLQLFENRLDNEVDTSEEGGYGFDYVTPYFVEKQINLLRNAVRKR